MSSTLFSMKTISKTLDKMQKSRNKINYKDYRTLTDTLRESCSILKNQESNVEIKVFLNLLKDKLEIETESLSYLAEETIDKDQIREHHDLILAYSKIDNLLKSIRENTTRQENFYGYTNPINFKGEHLVASVIKEHADHLVIKHFNLKNEEIKQSGSNQIHYNHPDKTISTSGYTSLNRCYRATKGDVFHIDREITLEQYITYALPTVKEFYFVNII